jgi:hypothetical protein
MLKKGKKYGQMKYYQHSNNRVPRKREEIGKRKHSKNNDGKFLRIKTEQRHHTERANRYRTGKMRKHTS